MAEVWYLCVGEYSKGSDGSRSKEEMCDSKNGREGGERETVKYQTSHLSSLV